MDIGKDNGGAKAANVQKLNSIKPIKRRILMICKLDTNVGQLPRHEFGLEPDSCLLM